MTDLAKTIRAALVASAEPQKAPQMQAYMKSEMPFFGVSSVPRKRIEREVRADVRALTDWRALVDDLWSNATHREERYLALAVLRIRARDLQEADIAWLRRLIVEGSWWDLVDEIAGAVLSPWVKREPTLLTFMDEWIDDEVLWVRRAAIISQLKCKEATDAERLFRYALQTADEKDFFIRKAIGWALRQHARHDPEAVRAFIDDHGNVFSGLTVREATKHLKESES